MPNSGPSGLSSTLSSTPSWGRLPSGSSARRAPGRRPGPARPGRRLLAGALGAVLSAGALVVAIPAALAPAAAEPLGPRVVRGTGATPSPSAGTTTAVASGTATVSGSGYGHGVGMSQYGAMGMAKAGFGVQDILTHYYSGVTVAAVTDARPLAVNVAHGASALTLAPAAVSGSGQQVRLITPGATSILVPGDSARVTPTSSGVTVRVTRGGGSTGTGPTALTASALDVRWTGTRALSGPPTLLSSTSVVRGSTKRRDYRWGAVRVSHANGLLESVITLDLHAEYLRGIAEMPSSWPAAALQAQVTVARSYALVAAATAPRSSCGGCQIWDDQRSQMYTGWAKESERIGSVDYGAKWVAAVTATQGSATTGLAVLYGGKPINAVYSSSTGGRTRDSAAVWGGSLPYLRSVSDAWSLDRGLNPSFAAWTRSVPVSGLTAVFGVPTVSWVGVTARDGAGAATTVTAVSGTGQRVSVDGESFRSRFGLPSSWVGAVVLPTG